MHGAVPAGLELDIRAKSFAGADGVPRPVLRDTRIAVRPGEVLALLGRSATGKSTLLHIALGLDADFEGTVTLPRGRIGAVFQEPRLLPWLTVEANLRLVAGAAGPAPDIPALLAAVGVPEAALLRPGELSLGMARRVALARALAVAPALLVLDEPFASLDPRLVATLADLVAQEARGRGAAVLLATHDLEEALAIADRLLVIAGRPAGLASDVALPPEAEARANVAEGLRARFAFLRRDADGIRDADRAGDA
jgi:NitT/TauT family transport system ATP-binding protein